MNKNSEQMLLVGDLLWKTVWYSLETPARCRRLLPTWTTSRSTSRSRWSSSSARTRCPSPAWTVSDNRGFQFYGLFVSRASVMFVWQATVVLSENNLGSRWSGSQFTNTIDLDYSVVWLQIRVCVRKLRRSWSVVISQTISWVSQVRLATVARISVFIEWTVLPPVSWWFKFTAGVSHHTPPPPGGAGLSQLIIFWIFFYIKLLHTLDRE